LEVLVCAPAYGLALFLEMAIFAGCASLGQSRLGFAEGAYEEFHWPVLCMDILLLIAPVLVVVQMSGVDEDALVNDPDYASPEPSKRAAAVQRALAQAKASWHCSVWANLFISLVLTGVFGWVSYSSPRDKVPRAHTVYCMTISVLMFVTAICNLMAISRVRKLGARGFAGGADALTLQAKVLLMDNGAPDSAKSDAQARDGDGLRQRRRSLGTAEKATGNTEPAESPQSIAQEATQMYLKSELDRQGYLHVLDTIDLKVKAGSKLHELVESHEKSGDGNWEAFKKALQDVLSSTAEVPKPKKGSEE